MDLLEIVTGKALDGIPCSIADALKINETYSTDMICDAANRVRQKWLGDKMDTCSIVNAKSGKCSEDCKWCAQSRFHNTGCEEYESISDTDLMRAVRINDETGVARFSLVTSGRKVSPLQIGEFCEMYDNIRNHSSMGLCASMGLLTKDELTRLKQAGVTRYHCNLETSAAFFPKLCSTHTREDKLKTISAAREAGMEVCSGGIIGMGETMRDRLEMVAEAVAAGACSIPVNILNPIKGTPLENTPLIDEEEIIRSIALSRLVAPKCAIRFAGGRARLSREANVRILRGGANGALVGDMLTTIGNNIEQDREMFRECGFVWDKPGEKN